MELRHQNFRRALDLVKRATTMPPGRAHSRMTVEEERQLPVQQRLYRCMWMCVCVCVFVCGHGFAGSCTCVRACVCVV